MRRGRGNDLEYACISKAAEDGEQVAVARFEALSRVDQQIAVEACKFVQLRMTAMSLELALREIDGATEVLHVTLAQQFVLQHGAKRGRNAHRDAERHAIVDQPLHHSEERDVGLGDGFEEPALFKKFLVLGMTNERQVRVEDERQGAFTHRALFAQAARAAIG